MVADLLGQVMYVVVYVLGTLKYHSKTFKLIWNAAVFIVVFFIICVVVIGFALSLTGILS